MFDTLLMTFHFRSIYITNTFNMGQIKTGGKDEDPKEKGSACVINTIVKKYENVVVTVKERNQLCNLTGRVYSTFETVFARGSCVIRRRHCMSPNTYSEITINIQPIL